MTDPNNPDDPHQPDPSQPAFVVVAIPALLVVPDEVLQEVEIYMTNGGGNDDDVGDSGVALAFWLPCQVKLKSLVRQCVHEGFLYVDATEVFCVVHVASQALLRP
jgi:hypothetical protein